MISRRTAFLLKWSLLFPAGFVGMFVSERYQSYVLHRRMPGWKFIDAALPWYFYCCGYIFILGCFLAVLAFLSLLRDRFHRVQRAE